MVDSYLAQKVAERGAYLTYYDNPEAIKNFPLGDSDLIIAGYPKSGTNWMQVVLANLWDGWGTCAISDRGQVPNLSGANDIPGYAGYDCCINAKSPRLMKAHFAREYMPRRWPEHGKVIHVLRNPKDVCVSLYNEFRSSLGIVDTFDEHFEKFMSGQCGPYDSYLANNLSWREFDHPNLLKITYEEARRDIRTVLRTVIEFVGRPVSPERLEEVLAKTEFKAMQTNELRLQVNHFRYDDKEKPFLRKGVVGDWQSVLSEAQAARIDREILPRLKDYALDRTGANE